MATAVLRVVTTPGLDSRFIDAKSIGLRVEVDGQRLQYFTLLASGQELVLKHPEVAEDPDFWRAAVAVAADQLPERLAEQDVPLPDATQPINLAVDFGAVERRLAESRSSLPSIEPDSVVATWTA